MLNKILYRVLYIGVIFFSLPAFSDTLDIAINPDYPDKYVVKKGDTLWDISAQFLQEPWLWPEIWEGNPQIENPHLIYPGDIVTLRYKGDQPRLVVNAEEEALGISPEITGIEDEKPSQARVAKKIDRDIKLSPKIREIPRESQEAIPSIPLDAIYQFLQVNRIVAEGEMDHWPYILSSYDQHLIGSKGNTIYVRGLSDEQASEKQFSIYRQGPPYYKYSDESISKASYPRDEDIIGYGAIYVGDAVISKTGDPASALVVKSDREVLVGDRLLPKSKKNLLPSEFFPKRLDQDLEGHVISVVDGVKKIGQYQIVVIDVGQEDGLKKGVLLEVYKRGAIVKDHIAPQLQKMVEKKAKLVDEDPDLAQNILNNESHAVHSEDSILTPGLAYTKIQLPEEKIGILLVITAFEHLSYALVMEVTDAINTHDTVRTF